MSLQAQLDEARKQWTIIGTYYGYPECCIEDFVQRSLIIRKAIYERDTETIDKYRKFPYPQDGFVHGFIPCPVCAEKTQPGEEHMLITNRICPSPFPIDNMDDDHFEAYFTKANL